MARTIPMIVLSLFDGISCGRLSLERAGIKVDKYYSSEIDKHCLKIAEKNYPDNIQLGDVNNWINWDIEKPDIIIGGFPCQPYSTAGKRKGIDDNRGYIIHRVFEVLTHYQPFYFLLENVKGLLNHDKGNTFKYILRQLNECSYAVDWIIINSAKVSAQNRERVYITGKRLDLCQGNFYDVDYDKIKQSQKESTNKSIGGTFDWDIHHIDGNKLNNDIKNLEALPKSEHTRLHPPTIINTKTIKLSTYMKIKIYNSGITQPEDKGIYLKDIIEQGAVDQDKSYCIDANYFKGGNLKSYFEKHRRQLVFELKSKNKRVCDISIDDRGVRPYQGDKARSGLSEYGRISFDTAKSATITANHSPKVLQTSERGRRLTPDGAKRDDKNGIVVRGYEVRPHGKTCTLTTVQKDNYVTENYIIRKLTPIECERLQTLPDNYTKGISNAQRYKALGNGWTVDVVSHIFNYLKEQNEPINRNIFNRDS